MIDQVAIEFYEISSKVQIMLQQEKIPSDNPPINNPTKLRIAKHCASHLSLEAATIDIERVAVQFDIDDLQEAISDVKVTIQESKSMDTEDIICIMPKWESKTVY